MNFPESYINFEVYEDTKRFCGIAQATLPNIQFIVQSVNGAGIGGNIDAVIPGMMDALSLGLSFKSFTEDAINLTKPEIHSVDLRIAEGVADSVSGNKGVVADKYVMDIMPKSVNLGNVAPATPGDVSGDYAVHTLKAYRGGKRVLDIEPYNFKCEVDGHDYLAEVREALGRT